MTHTHITKNKTKHKHTKRTPKIIKQMQSQQKQTKTRYIYNIIMTQNLYV